MYCMTTGVALNGQGYIDLQATLQLLALKEDIFLMYVRVYQFLGGIQYSFYVIVVP